MTIRLNIGAKDRVMSERGITTKVKNEVDCKTYWVVTTLRGDGTWITGVAEGKLFGLPGRRVWEITTATSEKESMELHLAVEEIVQHRSRHAWESSLPGQRLVARRTLDEAEQSGVIQWPILDEPGHAPAPMATTPEEAASLAVTPPDERAWIEQWMKGGPNRTLQVLRQQYDLVERHLAHLYEHLIGVIQGKPTDPDYRVHLQAAMEEGASALAQVQSDVLVHAWDTMARNTGIPQVRKDMLRPIIESAIGRSLERERRAGGH